MAAEFNWCRYMLKCLIDHTRVWQANKEKNYTGPALFITLLYMDRVVIGYRSVARTIPAIKKWKEPMLLNRQNLELSQGGFGQGYCDGPCTEADVVAELPLNAHADGISAIPENVPDIPAVVVDVMEAVNEVGDDNANLSKRVNADNADENQEDITAMRDAHEIATMLLKKGKLITDTLTSIVDIVKNVPPHLLANTALRKAVESTLLLTPTSMKEGVHDAGSSGVNPTQEALDFWDKPDTVDAVLEMERAALQRNEVRNKLKKNGRGLVRSDNLGALMDVARTLPTDDATLDKYDEFEPPSFSLGLSQMDVPSDTVDVPPTKIQNPHVGQSSKDASIHGKSDLQYVQEKVPDSQVDEITKDDAKQSNAHDDFFGPRHVVRTYETRNKRKNAEKKGKGVSKVRELK